MEDLFIEPRALPGGHEWEAACSALKGAAANITVSTHAQHALRCHSSPTAGLAQVFLLLCVYGGVLFKASELIAHGSELLLLVPSLRGIVGSVVLPIFGALPDGAIVLFSGLGPNAQETLSIGVGALAGSTSMLLTIPWFLSIVAGRVNVLGDGEVATYRHRPKLYPPGNFKLSGTGVQPLHMVTKSGKIMLLTATSYLVIQAAAIRTGTFFASSQTTLTTMEAAASERGPAIFCFITCLTFFVWYLYYQISASDADIEYRETVVDEIKQKAIRNGQVSLTAAFTEIRPAVFEANESTGLQDDNHKKERLSALLRTFFHAYDRDSSLTIDRLELQNLMMDLGEKCSSEEITQLYKEMDTNNNGKIELLEFTSAMPDFIASRSRTRDNHEQFGSSTPEADAETGTARVEQPDDTEEEEEVPYDLRDSDPDTQIKNVMRRSFTMMFVGTALVLVFSDPMVNVMSDFGERIGISAFYISFVLAPLASNASELLAAYSYALKKTRKTVTISFSTLLGAAILNNTFVLSIFMLLITIKGLAWQFTAETISIIFVEIAVYFFSQKKIITLRDGFYVLAIYPASLMLVAFLENVVGLD